MATQYIYAISGPAGAIKIGLSSDPVRRAYHANVYAPGPCHLLGYKQGSWDDERRVHEMLKSSKLHREWYKRDDAVEAFLATLDNIGDLPSGAATPRPWALETSFNAILRRYGWRPSKLADALHVHRGTVTKWGQSRVPKWHLEDIHRLTGIKPQALRPDLFITPKGANHDTATPRATA